MACAVFLVVGSFVFAHSAGQGDRVVIRDEFSTGSHHLSGMVMVRETCDELKEHVEQLGASAYKIVFETWKQPAVPCAQGPVPRVFHDALSAPVENVDFIAMQDGAPLPITIVPIVQH